MSAEKVLLNLHEKVFELRKHQFTLLVSEDFLFMPNATTKVFTKTIEIKEGDVVFDIGSGIGPLTVWAAKEPSSYVYAVEIVSEQCEVTRENVQKNHLEHKVQVLEGSLFDAIPVGVKADVIIADVSGIARRISRVLGWYPESIPTGGKDGTEVIIPAIEQAGNYLKPGGRFYFAVGGLSKFQKILDIAERKFKKLILKNEVNFPLEKDQVRKIQEHGVPGTFTLEKKGSRFIWKGWFYEASEPG